MQWQVKMLIAGAVVVALFDALRGLAWLWRWVTG